MNESTTVVSEVGSTSEVGAIWFMLMHAFWTVLPSNKYCGYDGAQGMGETVGHF